MKLTRRRFLAASALALSQGLANADDVQEALPLGFSLYGMKSLDLKTATKTCAEIGYDCVEMAVMPDWPADPQKLSKAARAELRTQLTDLKLGLPALMENLPLLTDQAQQINRLQAAAQLGHDLSPDRPPLIETILGGKPSEWEQVKQAMADRLHVWAEAAEKSDVTIAVKPHVGGALHTPNGALWLMQQVKHKRIRLAFDYSHFILRQFPLAETIAALVPHSVFVHVKDAKGTADKFEFLLPGETGAIDYADLLTRARQAGYRDSVVVEVSGMISSRPGYDPAAAARRSYQLLAPAFEKAGVKRPR